MPTDLVLAIRTLGRGDDEIDRVHSQHMIRFGSLVAWMNGLEVAPAGELVLELAHSQQGSFPENQAPSIPQKNLFLRSHDYYVVDAAL